MGNLAMSINDIQLSVQKFNLGLNDTLVVKLNKQISDIELSNIHKELKDAFGRQQKIIILDADIDISVIHETNFGLSENYNT